MSVFVCCVSLLSCIQKSKSVQDIYTVGIENFFNNIPEEIDQNIFDLEACILSTGSISNDRECREFINFKYLEKGYQKIDTTSYQILSELLLAHFDGVKKCSALEQTKNIRRDCRNIDGRCFGVTPIFSDKASGDYFFTLLMPPNIGIEIKVSNHMEPSILKFYAR